MLQTEDKMKLESYIDKLIENLKSDTNRAIKRGLSREELIEKVTSMTVNKLTPESKMIMSSAYNMMMEKTLAEDYFIDSTHKAAFYSADILKNLTMKFDFEVPRDINYNQSNTEVKKMIASGSVVIVGGVISISLKSWMPIGIAAIIAGIMALVLKNYERNSSSSNIDNVINDYYSLVKNSLMAWIESIENFYDSAVSEIKEGR